MKKNTKKESRLFRKSYGIHLISNLVFQICFCFCLLSLGLSCKLNQKKVLPDNATIILNGILINGTGEQPLLNHLIAFQNDSIIAIGFEEEFTISENAIIIDAKNGTILPGFIDSHTHILGRKKNRENMDSLRTELSFWLKTGITSIRDLGSHYGKTGNIQTLRKSLKEWGNSVPTVVLVGPYIAAPEGHPIASGISREWVYEPANENEARQTAEKVLSDGADGLKIAVERRYTEDAPFLTAGQVAAITQVAHDHDTWVSAHVTLPVDAEIAVLNGVDDLAHPPAGHIPDNLINEMISRDVLLGTTLMFQDGKENRYWLRDYNLSGVDTTENRKSQIKSHRHTFFKKFLEEGGKISLGSDFPYFNFGRPGGMPIEEMERMLEMGIKPMEIIVASTANAAEACGLENQIGKLEVGKKADIIIVNGNPLKDISAMKDVVVVIKNGEIIISADNENESQ